MGNLNKIVYLTEEQFSYLISNGSITVNNKTVQYSEDDIYITPEITDNNLVSATKPRWLRFDPGNKKGLIISGGTIIRQENGINKIFSIDTKIDLSSMIFSSGTDYFVYLLNDGSIIAATTAPANSVKIGRFHTLCVDAGSMTMIAPDAPSCGRNVGETFLVKSYRSDEDPDFYNFYNKTITAVTVQTAYDVITCTHPLSGFTAGDILPESVFCTTWKPDCLYDDAMVYDKDTDICVDVYLQSGRGSNTRSAYGGTRVVSRSGYNHLEDMRQVGKRLLKNPEFTSIALGSNEKTSINGAADATYVGGHVDTTSRRMISAIGCEECCGYFWQFLSGFGSSTGTDLTARDGHGSFGYTYGSIYGVFAGGGFNTTANGIGSRARSYTTIFESSANSISTRGCTSIFKSPITNRNI